MPGSQGALGGHHRRHHPHSRIAGKKEEHRAYLFPDFASGLAAMHQAQRSGLRARASLSLSDDGETRFLQAMWREEGRDRNFADHFSSVYLSVRRFDGGAAPAALSRGFFRQRR